MKHSFKNKLFVLLTLFALAFSALGTTSASAAPLGAPTPTVSTDSIDTIQARNVNATISNAGDSSVMAYGVVYNTSGTPTLSDSKVERTNSIVEFPYAYHIGLTEMALTAGTKYYVRAFATNSLGTSYGAELVVYGLPGAFTVIAPSNGATDVSTSPTLSWNPSASATDYQYCVAADINDCVGDMFGANWHSTGGATSANLSGLSPNTTYSWGVRASVGSPASYIWGMNGAYSFTTASVTSHTVTFDANGGSGSMSDQSASSATALTTNSFTRSGYSFNGWNTASDGSGTYYADGESYPFTADITLYAQWIDATAPVASIDTKPANPTPITSASFTFSATDNLTVNPNFTFYCNLDAGTWELCNSGSKSYSNLSIGDHTFELDAYDEAGNVSVRQSYTWTINETPTFQDISSDHWAWQFVERLYAAGITSGCSNTSLSFCPEGLATRAQMAVFLLKAEHGASYSPPAVGASTGFNDVATDHWAAAWIKQLAAESITSGCGGGNFCPEDSVTRAQMAVFLLKAKHGASYSPPTASGIFSDVPTDHWAAAWIEQLAAEGITSGCAAGTYCPEDSVTRAQMAVFLIKAFNLP